LRGPKAVYRYPVGWLEEDLIVVAEWARPKKFSGAFGIVLGGVSGAAMLANLLDLEFIRNWEEVRNDTIVFDDLSDSGDTILAYERAWGFTPKFAALFSNPATRRKPDIWLYDKIVPWIRFPGETKEGSNYRRRYLEDLRRSREKFESRE